jgi:hypothetical protein
MEKGLGRAISIRSIATFNSQCSIFGDTGWLLGDIGLYTFTSTSFFLCTFECLFNASCREKERLQIWQENGFIPLWTLTCLSKCSLLWKVNGQCGHGFLEALFWFRGWFWFCDILWSWLWIWFWLWLWLKLSWYILVKVLFLFCGGVWGWIAWFYQKGNFQILEPFHKL